MAEQSFLAKLGLRFGAVGSSVALGLAAPIANADYSATAGTAANRTGVYFDQTAAAEKISYVVGGQTGPIYTHSSIFVNANYSGAFLIPYGITPIINGAAGQNRNLFYCTAGVNRWDIGVNNTAESGGNLGSLLFIASYTDASPIIDVPIQFNRGSGSSTCVRSVVISTGASGASFAIASNAGTSRTATLRTGSLARWSPLSNGTAESGGNAGSNWQLIAASDAGTTIDVPYSIARAAQGVLTVARPLTHSVGALTGAQTIMGASGVWNNGATTFTGWKSNVTVTAEGPASLLVDLQVGGASRFSITGAGAAVTTGCVISTIFDTDLLDTVASLAINRTTTLTAGVTDGLAYNISTPTINGAFTVTRLNYMNLDNPTGSATVTDAPVFDFNAAAGTHKCLDAGSTKTSPGTVSAWIKHNINGVVYYSNAYLSKTS